MQTHPHILGDLATERGRVRHAEAAHARHLVQARTSARGGTGGLRVARGPLVTALIVLATALTLSSAVLAAPQEPKAAKIDAANYFVQHPGSPNGRTDIDPFDAYAPLDTGGVLTSVGFTTVEDIGEEWAPPPSLGRPGQPS